MLGEVAIAILAAGRGARLQSSVPKPLTEFKGQPLILHALQAAQASSLGPIVTVVGYQARQVAARLPAGIRIVVNSHWQTGIASSVKVALEALMDSPQVSAVCIGLADQPLMSAIAYQRLAAAHRVGATLAVATYYGKRRNPVLIARPLWSDAQQISGDQGLKHMIQQYPFSEVCCEDIASSIDVDTMADLKQLEGSPCRVISALLNNR